MNAVARNKFLYAILTVFAFAFTACNDSFTDERDGQSYDVVQIGDQIWMAENLNFAGTDLATFCPDGDDRNCKKYGRLYTWEAAQTICPEGWQLPTRDDLMKLIAAAETSSSQPGVALKSTSGWFKKGNGTDAVHFNALPAGYMFAADPSSGQPDVASGQPAASGAKPAASKFDGIGGYAYFWASTTDADEPAFAHYLFLDFSSPVAEIKSFDKNSARSVRCIKK